MDFFDFSVYSGIYFWHIIKEVSSEGGMILLLLLKKNICNWKGSF